MEERWIRGLDPWTGVPVCPRSGSHARTFQREDPAFPLDFLPQLSWTPHSQDELSCSMSWDIPDLGMELRASQISLCHLPAIPRNLQKGRTGFFGIFLLLPECSMAPSRSGSQIPVGKRARMGSSSRIPPAGLNSGISGHTKAWKRQIFHAFVQAPFEPVPCCRFFIPTEHPQFPKIAQFPARPTAWDGISVPNSSLLSPLDSASGGIADGFRAELPEPFGAAGRAFSIKEKRQRPKKKSPNPPWSGLKAWEERSRDWEGGIFPKEG